MSPTIAGELMQRAARKHSEREETRRREAAARRQQIVKTQTDYAINEARRVLGVETAETDWTPATESGNKLRATVQGLTVLHDAEASRNSGRASTLRLQRPCELHPDMLATTVDFILEVADILDLLEADAETFGCPACAEDAAAKLDAAEAAAAAAAAEAGDSPDADEVTDLVAAGLRLAVRAIVDEALLDYGLLDQALLDAPDGNDDETEPHSS